MSDRLLDFFSRVPLRRTCWTPGCGEYVGTMLHPGGTNWCPECEAKRKEASRKGRESFSLNRGGKEEVER